MGEILRAIILVFAVVGGIFFGLYYYSETHISCKTQYETVTQKVIEALGPEYRKWLSESQEQTLAENDIFGITTIFLKPVFGKYDSKKSDHLRHHVTHIRTGVGGTPVIVTREGWTPFSEYHHFVFSPRVSGGTEGMMFPVLTEPFLLGENKNFFHITRISGENPSPQREYTVEYQTKYGDRETQTCINE